MNPAGLFRAELTTEAAIAWIAVILFCVVAAVLDVRYRRIPNALTVTGFLAGLVWAGWRGGPGQVAESAAASVLVALPFLLMFVLSLGGAGDVKLMAAVGAWLGLQDGLSALALIVLSGGCIGLVISIAQGRVISLLRNIWGMGCLVLVVFSARTWREYVGLLPKSAQMNRMPYALAILCGVCLAAGGVRLW